MLAESKEHLEELIMEVKMQSEKSELILNIKKIKITFRNLQLTAKNLRLTVKKRLILQKKETADKIIKNRDTFMTTKIRISKARVFQ